MAKMATSDFPPIKCAKKERQLDWISRLPDEILINMLSFLALEEAARTSVLSTRWIDLWLNVAMLDFDSPVIWRGIVGMNKLPNYKMLLEKSPCIYVDWVNKVLQSHKAIVLDVFRIRFNLTKSSSHDIDRWLQHAFARRVQRLELDLSDYARMAVGAYYDFPHYLLGLGGGNSSNSCGNGFNSDAILFDFKSLRTLTFCCVDVSSEVLKFFLHSCPSLEHLRVSSSNYLEKFEVRGLSLALKHLELMYCPRLSSLIVCDTNIVSLRTTSGHCLVLKNVPMLVDVLVGGFNWQTNGYASLVYTAISWLSCCLSKLKVLSLRINNVQSKLERDTNTTLPQLTNLKQLTFCTCAPRGDKSLMPFTSLIRASPNLEKFVLKFDREGDVDMKRTSSKKGVAFPLKQLKVVEFWGYSGRRTEVELIEYFVQNGISLERVIIEPRSLSWLRIPVDNPEEDVIFRELAKKQLKGWLPQHIELVVL